MNHYEKLLITIILEDESMMSILKTVEKLRLHDAWICAGIIRNKVWDMFHHISTPLNDIDVIYFDQNDTSEKQEKQIEKQLHRLLPSEPWSVKNQARMHVISGVHPFTSSYDGVRHFPETPTAVAARLKENTIEIMAPYGLDDLFELQVNPTPIYDANSERYHVYVERIIQKNWQQTWNKLFINL